MPLRAQEQNPHPPFGAALGLTFNFGSTVNRLGAFANTYYAREHFQLNAGLRFHYNFSTFGPKKPRPEWQIHLGALVSYGAVDSIVNPFIHALSNQTPHRNSVGYAYHWYLEKVTRQPTGSLALQFGKWEIITENDALAGEGQDKYRTGSLQLAYRHQDSRLALNTILWTGKTQDPNACRISEAGDYPCRFGYKDISKAPCGRFSHGILALQYEQHLPYNQVLNAGLGIDSERIRHFFQNRLIHDMHFWPKKWNKAKNPHLPMLDKNGDPYLFQKDQELKPSRLFFDLGLNAPLFY